MCTVTYIPSKDKIFLVSNRDEKHWRLPAIPPQAYDISSGKIYFPKDADEGGSWFAVHENGNTLVLLNGGFKNHTPQPRYERSRGLVLLDLAQTANPFDNFRSINLENIEPFTLVLWSNEKLFECRWDGERKHSKQLDKTLPYIWSSVTVYDDEAIAIRENQFENWLDRHPDFSIDDILDFHQFSGEANRQTDLLRNRNDKIFTVSITGVEISSATAHLKYLDLLTNQVFLQNITFKKETIPNL
jgi:transport and Golgi organization protein 2